MKNIIFICLIAILFIKCYYCQDIIFPDDEQVTYPREKERERGNKILITDRLPVLNSTACPKNMLQYPGVNNNNNNSSIWICDCQPTYLYFALNDSCYEAYRQGPCRKGEYLVLAPVNNNNNNKKRILPTCQVNPCNKDGIVMYKGKCHGLKTTGGPCEPDVIGVNETTYKLECITTGITPFIIIDAPQIDPCPAGSRRNSLGSCKTAL